MLTCFAMPSRGPGFRFRVGINTEAELSRATRQAASGFGERLMCSTLKMNGSPLVTSCEIEEFPPRTCQMTLASQFSQSLSDFSIVRSVKKWGAFPWSAHT